MCISHQGGSASPWSWWPPCLVSRRYCMDVCYVVRRRPTYKLCGLFISPRVAQMGKDSKSRCPVRQTWLCLVPNAWLGERRCAVPGRHPPPWACLVGSFSLAQLFTWGRPIHRVPGPRVAVYPPARPLQGALRNKISWKQPSQNTLHRP